MAGTKKVAAVGLRDLSVAARITEPGAPTWIDVLGVTEASFKLAVSEIEQWGDDTLMNTFYHSQKGTISCRTGYMNMAIFEALSGNVVASSAGVESIAIGTQAELTPPSVMVRAIVENARNSNGGAAKVRAYFYNCTVKTVFETIPDMGNGKLSEVTLNFNVYSSATNELGEDLTVPAFGRLELE